MSSCLDISMLNTLLKWRVKLLMLDVLLSLLFATQIRVELSNAVVVINVFIKFTWTNKKIYWY